MKKKISKIYKKTISKDKNKKKINEVTIKNKNSSNSNGNNKNNKNNKNSNGQNVIIKKISKKERNRIKRENELKMQKLEQEKEQECKERMKSVKYFVVVDYEWTCYNPIELECSEIIEIGCQIVKYSYKNKTIKDKGEFQQYVKPTVNPILTKICTSLTGIEQKTVDNAPTFDIAWKNFMDFLKSQKVTPKNSRFVTWGSRDFDPVIPDALKRFNIKPPKHGYPEYFDLQYEYALFKKKFCPFFKLSSAIEECKLDFSQFGGQHHSGIVDAKSEAGVMKKIINEGWDPHEIINCFKIKDKNDSEEKKN